MTTLVSVSLTRLWQRLRVFVYTEAALAMLVVAGGVTLAAARPASDVSSPFPRAGDLTMAATAGRTVVGFSLRPARPGRNQLVTYLMPDPAPAATVRLSVAGVPVTLQPCGASCRTASIDLSGGEALAIDVPGDDGGTAAITLPALPAADGTAVAQRAVGCMATLDSYRVDETLSGIRSSYVFARPDSMWMQTFYGDVASDTLWLGTKIYRRSGPAAPWRSESMSGAPPVPYFIWTAFQPFVDVTVVGHGEVDQTPVTVVSLFGGHGADPEPVWFTLWIDTAACRVRRSQMFAPDHAMDDRYWAFDSPARFPRTGQG